MRRISGLAFVLVMTFGTEARAGGEASPMFGAAVTWSPEAHESPGAVGVAVDLAWWYKRLGAGVETTGRWPVDGNGRGAVAVAGSVRLLAIESILPSLVEPRDVEFGLELHGIIERVWWTRPETTIETTRYGAGFALRLRGGSDDDASRLLAESRLFVRAYAAPSGSPNVIARMETPTVTAPRELLLLVGLGASFGAGTPRYVSRFRRRAFDSTLL